MGKHLRYDGQTYALNTGTTRTVDPVRTLTDLTSGAWVSFDLATRGSITFRVGPGVPVAIIDDEEGATFVTSFDEQIAVHGDGSD